MSNVLGAWSKLGVYNKNESVTSKI